MIKRDPWMIMAVLFFAMFSVLAMGIGMADVMNPIYPWGHRLPILGQIALVVSCLSMMATGLLWKLKKLGGYLGIVSFAISFTVNIYVGEHLMLHIFAGVIAGVVLFFPLALGWKTLS